MFRYAFLLFFAYLICEIFLTSYFYANFPPLFVTFFLISMVFFGLFLIKRSQIFLATSINTSIFSPKNLSDILKQNVLYILSAILFIIPGIFSDFIGAILLLFVVYLKINAKMSQNKNNFKGEEDVIDAEIIDNYDYIDTDNINRRM